MVKGEALRSRQRATVLIVAVLFFAMFVLINAQQWLLSAVIYIILGLISIVLYREWSQIGRPSEPRGIDDNWVKDFIVGGLIGIGIIVLGEFVPGIGAIAIPPTLGLVSDVGKFFIIVIAASVLEETMFRGFLLSLFADKMRINKHISIILQGVLFSLFHIVAYAGSSGNLSAVQGSFITAAIMGIVFGYIATSQNSLIGSMATHSVLNFWIGFVSLNIIFALSTPLLIFGNLIFAGIFLITLNLNKSKRVLII